MNINFYQPKFLNAFSPVYPKISFSFIIQNDSHLRSLPQVITSQIVMATSFNNTRLAPVLVKNQLRDNKSCTRESNNKKQRVADSMNFQQIVPENMHISNKIADDKFKLEIDQMLASILSHLGKNDNLAIEALRKTYYQNPYLLQIYDKLVMKYYAVKKTKEDKLRYILRKIFKLLKTCIMIREKVSSREATIILGKKYFQSNLDKIQQSQPHIENDDQLLELFMPYNNKSHFKTMNSDFLAEILSSETFCKEYLNLLPEFCSMLRTDNKRKKEKLSRFIVECIKSNSISKIGSFSRLPWLEVWMQDTQEMAFGLLQNQKLDFNSSKKIKIEN